MRACSHASREVCASAQGVARVVRVCVALVCIWMCALRARADEPAEAHEPPEAHESPEAHDGPFELRLSLENDNLFLGAYARMVDPDLDGTDLGRTHATAIGMSYGIQGPGPRLRSVVDLEVSSALFTRSISGERPAPMETLPIHFHELNRIRLGGGVGASSGPWYIRWGLGADVSNREGVFVLGASGQQRWWHEFSRETLQNGTWLYDYQPDGVGLRVGVAVDARAGGAVRHALASWAWIEAEGDVGGRAGSLPGASWLEMRGRVAAALGDPRGVRFVLALEQSGYLWLEDPGAMLRSTLDARLDLHVVVLQVAVTRYAGDQNVPYFAYAFENTTMTFGFWLRI